MDAVTHPHESVVQYLTEHFVPCKLESARHVELARRFNARWLPGIVIADAQERPAHVSIGFLPPPDLLSEATFGRAIAAMGEKRYEDAHALFRKVADETGAERAPEALFWWGISRYRQLKEFGEAVREPWGRILERYPRSQWARKVGYALGVPPTSG